MTRYAVTGAAGFIGSHLSEALLAQGHQVVGIDAFIPYYPREIKETNLRGLLGNPAFTFHEIDLRRPVDSTLFAECDAVFHLAAMAGLMLSWSELELYSTCNLLATQQVLEAARHHQIPQVIHVSTSSTYGKNATGPEDSPLTPYSPYGITKLAAENLCHAYEANFGIGVTVLRYFSVYGPRQRPDMAYNILIRRLLEHRPFKLFGDGEQTRSNTFVADCVNATLLACQHRNKALGQTFNVGGGEIISMNQVIALLQELTGEEAIIEHAPARPGDQKHTSANIEKAKSLLGYNPKTSVRDGLIAQVNWQRKSIL
jgi:nucleoside-diphosphate-sugar epimerase